MMAVVKIPVEEPIHITPQSASASNQQIVCVQARAPANTHNLISERNRHTFKEKGRHSLSEGYKNTLINSKILQKETQCAIVVKDVGPGQEGEGFKSPLGCKEWWTLGQSFSRPGLPHRVVVKAKTDKRAPYATLEA